MESAETSPEVPQDAATTNATTACAVSSQDGTARESARESASRTTSSEVPRRARALFEIDPGWPFVVAGLGLIVAGVLIPAQRDLHELRGSLEVHRALLEHSDRRLDAYDRFLVSVDEAEPQLVRRLAASQLNKMPADERPYLMLPSMNATVSDWIDASEPLEVPSPAPYPDTLLSRLATGPRRLWILASGVFLIFVGLVFGPSGTRRVSRGIPSGDSRRTARAPLAHGSSPRTRDASSNVDVVGSVAAIGAATLAGAPSSSAIEPATELATDSATALAEDAMLASVEATEIQPELAPAEAFVEQVDVVEIVEAVETEETVETFEVVETVETVATFDTVATSEVAEQPSIATSDVELTSEQVVTEVALIGHETSIDDEINLGSDCNANASEVGSSGDEAVESAEVLVRESSSDASEAEVFEAEVFVVEAFEAEAFEADELEADELETDEVASDELASDELASDELETDELASEDVECDDDERDDDERGDTGDADESDDSVERRAETIAIPGEHELAADAERPDAFDRALDTWSLFHGIDPSRWIDTSDRREDGQA